MSNELKKQQATVRRLASIGFPGTLALIGIAYALIPKLPGMNTAFDRLLLALRCDIIAALPLAAGIGVIGSGRFRSEAINPLAGKDSQTLQVHIRYLQNTLEQLMLFVLGLTALSTFLDASTARLLPILTGAFILARIVFWAGYLRAPLARGLGMAATFAVTVPMLLLSAGLALYAAIGGYIS